MVGTGGEGAATLGLTLMIFKNGRPEIAQFRFKDGEIGFQEFFVGSGGDGRYGMDIQMVPG